MAIDAGGRFTLDELSDATGVSERNIRFYITEGLLPPAGGRGRSAYYTPEHVQLLARISDLRNQRLSLDEIRAALAPPAPTAPPSDSDRWQRIRLHPDLDLFVREDAPESVHALAAELRAVARRWFGEEES